MKTMTTPSMSTRAARMTIESSRPPSGTVRKRKRKHAAPGARILAVGLSVSASVTFVNAMVESATDPVTPGEVPSIADSSYELPSTPPAMTRSSRPPITTSQAS